MCKHLCRVVDGELKMRKNIAVYLCSGVSCAYYFDFKAIKNKVYLSDIRKCTIDATVYASLPICGTISTTVLHLY